MNGIPISVIGGSAASERDRSRALELGRLLGEAGYTVLCGGGTGVMEAVCEGVRSVGGRTVGILPGEHHSEANPYVEIAIPTGMGTSRNRIVALSGKVVIAVGGAYGTLSEIAFALQAGRPVCVMGRWNGIDGVTEVGTPAEALEFVAENI